MKTLFFLALVALACFVGAAFILAKLKGGGRTGRQLRGVPPYFGKAPLTEPEQVLFHRLREAFPGKIVLAQVSMSALLGIRKNQNWQAQFNEISRKYVDFVLCEQDFSVTAVIELDDSTHQRGDRIKADVIKDVAFQSVGCRVIRFDVRSMPSVEQIREALLPRDHIDQFEGGTLRREPV